MTSLPFGKLKPVRLYALPYPPGCCSALCSENLSNGFIKLLLCEAIAIRK